MALGTSLLSGADTEEEEKKTSAKNPRSSQHGTDDVPSPQAGWMASARTIRGRSFRVTRVLESLEFARTVKRG